MGIQSIPEHELARLREKAKEITGSQFDYQSSYTELLSRRLNGEPLQYIEEYVPFYSIQINVDQRCLIPRPCLLYTSPSPRDQRGSRMPSSA